MKKSALVKLMLVCLLAFLTGCGKNEYINEDGMLVVEYEYIFTDEVNHTYLFADIQEEYEKGEHINESEFGFVYES